MKWFNVVHLDGSIQVRIDDEGHATITVNFIRTDEIVVRAIAKAVAMGARTGTLFTGDIGNEQMAQMHLMRAENGVTWLGGKVTRLDDGPEGPQFRIDWDVFPQITE